MVEIGINQQNRCAIVLEQDGTSVRIFSRKASSFEQADSMADELIEIIDGMETPEKRMKFFRVLAAFADIMTIETVEKTKEG